MRICAAYSSDQARKERAVRRLHFRKSVPAFCVLSALLCAGCASQQAQQQTFLWQPAASDFVTSNFQSEIPTEVSATWTSETSQTGWGAYSGARGQAEPQPKVHYTFRGENAEVALSTQ